MSEKELMLQEGIEFDSNGRMKYHSEFHFNQGAPWKESENEYLCKYAEIDDMRTISFALGRARNFRL